MSALSSLATASARAGAAVRRRHSRLRHYVPSSVVVWYKSLKVRLMPARRLYLPVYARTPAQAVFHCTFHKAGSQWIKSILTDPIVFQYSGLTHYNYQSRRAGGGDARSIREKTFPEGFPDGRIVSPLYVTYPNFAAIPKPERYKAFFVLRDPREMTVSWYFSTRQSHYTHPGSPLAGRREKLRTLSLTDGLLYAVDHWASIGIYEELATWYEAGSTDPSVLVVRFEDLISAEAIQHFQRLFCHLEIEMPHKSLEALVEAYSFARLSGRRQGESDERSHLRSGVAATWPQYFSDAICRRFEDVAGEVIRRTGYDAAGKNWLPAGQPKRYT